MANFFDNKARAAANTINGTSSKNVAAKETQNLQPWVEK